ncbi:hypothetical protein V2I01_00930 [Micromonospora sp. BRA006-A]|nr:hypothetical protein [Micromonospora sp. BRA006-A]
MLDALGEHPSAPGVTGARRRVTEWLLERQEPDGRGRTAGTPRRTTPRTRCCWRWPTTRRTVRRVPPSSAGWPGCWTHNARTAPGDGGTAPPRRPRTGCSPWPTRAGPVTPGSRRRWRGASPTVRAGRMRR